MKPYYQDPAVTIYHGDCREIVPQLAAGKYVVVTDPPYAETSLKWDRWVDGWPALASTVATSMWCFGSFRMFLDRWSEFDGWKLTQDLVWEKHNGSNSRTDRFRRVHEFALHFYRKDTEWESIYRRVPTTPTARRKQVRSKSRPPHWNPMDVSTYESEDGGPLLMRSVLQVRSCHGYAIHPTQKPEGIVRPLVEYAAGPGSIVLDLFMGSGTTLAVAGSMGISSIGIEANEADCELAVNRLAQKSLSL